MSPDWIHWYPVLLFVHVGCVITSGAGFLVRLVLRYVRPESLQYWVFRRLPHLVDTLLLVSAALLAWTLHQYPFVDGWLTAKVLALVAYIVAGAQALRGKTSSRRLGGAALALSAYAYIVSVAVTHQAAGFLRWLA